MTTRTGISRAAAVSFKRGPLAPAPNGGERRPEGTAVPMTRPIRPAEPEGGRLGRSATYQYVDVRVSLATVGAWKATYSALSGGE